MTNRRRRAVPILATALLVLTATIVTGANAADTVEPKEYAYILLQGRLSDASEKHPVAGATVLLTSESLVFESITDDRGVFIFDKLPVANYAMGISMDDGMGIHWAKDRSLAEPDRERLKIRFGKGKKNVIELVPRGDEVALLTPAPPPNMGRFGKQALIFLAGAVVLAL